jgi:cob(I)alamin adenosyltransferase
LEVVGVKGLGGCGGGERGSPGVCCVEPLSTAVAAYGLRGSCPCAPLSMLQSGGLASASLHVARTVCRRAERSVVSLGEGVPSDVLKFLNRCAGACCCLCRVKHLHLPCVSGV